MNLQTVGTENLPNVFIDKIYVYEYNQNSYEVIVTLKMYDHADSPSWRGRINDLNVKLFLTRDETQIEGLNNGTISLYDLTNSGYYQDILHCNSFAERSYDQNFNLYSSRASIIINKNIENLNVYAACFVEIDPRIGIAYFDKFYGPMCGERIIVGGQINQESGYFYYPDTNEEYGGPVHSSTNMYMEGSQHTSRTHREVRYVAEENAKIVTSVILGIYSDADAGPDSLITSRRQPFVSASSGPNPYLEVSEGPMSGEFDTGLGYSPYQPVQPPNFNLIDTNNVNPNASFPR